MFAIGAYRMALDLHGKECEEQRISIRGSPKVGSKVDSKGFR